ncbi:MAG: glycosyltransferase family 39 protein [Planctomycetota bacterium]
MSEKSRGFVVAALLLAIGMVHFSTLRPGQGWGGDFSMYIHHARNLAEGIPYAETGYIYNPGYATIGPPTYPPVCPLLLVPAYMVFGPSLEPMKLVMLTSLVLFLLFVFLSFRRVLPFWPTLIIVALVGLNRCFLGDVNSIRSDLPFMAILYLTILVIQKAYDTPAATPPRLGYLLTAAVLVCVAFGTRTLGALLLPSLLVYELMRYRRITRSAVLLVGVFVAAAVAQSLLVHSDVGYFDQYDVGPGVFLNNGAGYTMEFAAFWHNGYFKPAGALLFLAMTVLAAAGYTSSVRRQVTFLEIFPVLYMVAVLLFPGYAGRRYLQPVFPLFLLFAARGLESAWLARRETLRRVVFASLLVAVAVSYGASYTQLDLDMTEGIAKPESVAMFDYVTRQTEEDDVVIFIKPRVMALLTSRRASVYHMPRQDSELWDYFQRIGATHLVVVQNDEAFAKAEDPARLEYLRDFARRNATDLTPVFANADFRVYRIGHPDTAPSALAGGA